MTRFIILILSLFFACCTSQHPLLSVKTVDGLTGTAFYQQAASMNWKQRDSFALAAVRDGHLPGFLMKLVPVELKYFDSTTNKAGTLVFFVTPDYFAVGTNQDWARVPLTPMAAQDIADRSECILPTPNMVDLIYQQSKVKIEPVPLFAFRDSTPTFYHHHLIIEGQRQGKKGLIAGIKKDVVYTPALFSINKKDRVAIYGWHQPDGKPIQPLYTGHVNWYVDYSHGIRFVSKRMKLNGKWMDYTAVITNPILSKLLCGDGGCGDWKYK